MISMSEETPDNLCIAFLDLSYCRPIASLIQVLIYRESSTLQSHDFTKNSVLSLVGRAAKVHSIVLPGEGGEPLLHLLGSVPTNCPFTITRPCTRSVLHAGCAAKLHCPSPRVPESQSLLRIWDTVRTHGGAHGGAAQSCRC